MSTHAWNACVVGCPGWGLFNVGEATESIQRCDDCDRFPDDIAATEHVAHLWTRYFQREVPRERLFGAGLLVSTDLWRIRRLYRRDQFLTRIEPTSQP